MFQCAYNILIRSTQLMSNTIANIFVFLFLGINMTHKLISFTITIHSIVTRQHHSPCGGAGSMDNRRTIPFRNTQHHQTSNYHRVIQHHHPDEVNTTTRKLRGERVEHDTHSHSLPRGQHAHTVTDSTRTTVFPLNQWVKTPEVSRSFLHALYKVQGL